MTIEDFNEGYAIGWKAAQAEIERLRAALKEIACMRREDLYPEGPDNTAAAVAMAALRVAHIEADVIKAREELHSREEG